MKVNADNLFVMASQALNLQVESANYTSECSAKSKIQAPCFDQLTLGTAAQTGRVKGFGMTGLNTIRPSGLVDREEKCELSHSENQ